MFFIYLFYLKNKSDYHRNPIIDWTYTDDAENPVVNGSYVNAPCLTAAPNPFNPTVTIKFSGLAYDTDPQKVMSLFVFAPDGRLVYKEKTTVGAAVKGIVWNARDMKGAKLSTGIYFIKAELSGKSFVKKLTMIR